jgi:nucleoside-diphosphate-sugar epimerase
VRFLVLGGTGWLSGCVARTALAAGHQVTCLARGRSGPVPDGATLVRGDRKEERAYTAVADDTWDVVVDVSSQPGQVRDAAEALAQNARHYVYVSSGSVYADNHKLPPGDERRVLPPLDEDVLVDLEKYGEAKVACEQHVTKVFGDRALIARAGLIGGPGDKSDRSGYWPLRFARPAMADGAVLAPEGRGLDSQLVDVRDIGTWLADAGARGVSGVFDVTGETVPLAHHLAVARNVAGHAGPLVSAADDWLLGHGVEPWMGERSLPLWLPGEEYAGFNEVDSAEARAAGLHLRPLEETLTDVLAWEIERAPSGPRHAGLSDDDERALIDELGPGATAPG